MILFNNCRLPQSEIEAICSFIEPYIRVGDNGPNGCSRGDNKQTSFGINVLIINHGADGFQENPSPSSTTDPTIDPTYDPTTHNEYISEVHMIMEWSKKYGDKYDGKTSGE